jgi:CheY-like chemotaxis protein
MQSLSHNLDQSALLQGNGPARALGYESTLPLDWEEQAMLPEYEEIMAAMASGQDYTDTFTKRKRVLVVDDDLAARFYLRAKLALQDNVDVYEAVNGVEALEMVEHTVFDGVLLDVGMAGKDGYEVCRAIKRISTLQGTKPPKIFMITSRNGVVDRMRATLAGADAFFTKPPHPSDFGNLLSRL